MDIEQWNVASSNPATSEGRDKSRFKRAKGPMSETKF